MGERHGRSVLTSHLLRQEPAALQVPGAIKVSETEVPASAPKYRLQLSIEAFAA